MTFKLDQEKRKAFSYGLKLYLKNISEGDRVEGIEKMLGGCYTKFLTRLFIQLRSNDTYNLCIDNV